MAAVVSGEAAGSFVAEGVNRASNVLPDLAGRAAGASPSTAVALGSDTPRSIVPMTEGAELPARAEASACPLPCIVQAYRPTISPAHPAATDTSPTRIKCSRPLFFRHAALPGTPRPHGRTDGIDQMRQSWRSVARNSVSRGLILRIFHSCCKKTTGRASKTPPQPGCQLRTLAQVDGENGQPFLCTRTHIHQRVRSSPKLCCCIKELGIY